jgi:DHA2 family multidrug resistance protein
MWIGGRLVGRVDSRKLIAFGLLLLAISSWEMAGWTAQVGEWPLLWTNFVQGVGGGIILVPIQAIAFPALQPHRRTEAAAVYNLIRSLGASIGVSSALTLYVRARTATHAQLAEHASPYSEALQGQAAQGWNLDSPEALAQLEQQIDQQAAVIAYTNDFALFAVIAVAALPLLLLIGREAPPDKRSARTEGIMIGE